MILADRRQATRPRLCEYVYWAYCHMWTHCTQLC